MPRMLRRAAVLDGYDFGVGIVEIRDADVSTSRVNVGYTPDLLLSQLTSLQETADLCFAKISLQGDRDPTDRARRLRLEM